MEKITLTPIELKELKDEITFRVKTTITLKSLEKELKELNGITEKVRSLKTIDRLQWGAFLVLLAGLIALR